MRSFHELTKKKITDSRYCSSAIRAAIVRANSSRAESAIGIPASISNALVSRSDLSTGSLAFCFLGWILTRQIWAVGELLGEDF